MSYRFLLLSLILFYVLPSYAKENFHSNGYSYGFCFKADNQIIKSLNFSKIDTGKFDNNEYYILMLKDNENVDYSGEGLIYSPAILYILNERVYKVDGTVYNTMEKNYVKDSVLYISENNTDKVYMHGLFYYPAKKESDGTDEGIIYISLLGRVFHFPNEGNKKNDCVSKFPDSIIKDIVFDY
ncbi:hypothetical protein [Pluralibacter gergoviae]|uniref:hypothetical protein n=1 Tax=Pluralibacter gergoviae TaxID=61647 RepID=UPI000A6A7329|nr:hypothetical protein [Pluralibacter gergoviae]EKW9969607.1 hypothetical protein [Pluralibacter gergoviae]ELD4303926.1 hypothetical protein [Pluralibacter gergoviae]ELN2739577.1 hypothetical protein [Pluralibacter gergoviae]ELO7482453.1 hypothetical protein [Pluralibacter gergoviae]ELW9444615.1 hypothetical protein [Pluralibacter gergoviae]